MTHFAHRHRVATLIAVSLAVLTVIMLLPPHANGLFP